MQSSNLKTSNLKAGNLKTGNLKAGNLKASDLKTGNLKTSDLNGGSLIGKKKRRHLLSSQIILLGFAGMILLGTLLLMLPFATASGHGASFVDALFTATSATCVTGLVVQDTATYWSIFGKLVILTMIQIGGMGVVTLAVAVTTATGRQISLKQRSTMQEAISADRVGGIVKLTGFIIKLTLIFELSGAVLMAPTFCKEFGVGKGICYAIFHSISAFCNAGFDLMGVKAQYSSLTFFAANPWMNMVVMALIIIGGIGFLTWEDIANHRFRIRRYRMQSKIILTTSLLLTLLPAIYYFFGEFGGISLGKRILISLFQSVTTRTAGFNTMDFSAFSEGGLAITIFLMLIGGSPGSTAGGMKTTTIAVLFGTAISVFRRKEDTHFFGRRVADEAVRSALTIAVMYVTLFMVGGIIMSRVEGLPLMTCLFETGSAVGTVGVTLGITPSLGLISRGILVFLMYLGRVGGLTLIFSAVAANNAATMSKLPQEKLTVG